MKALLKVPHTLLQPKQIDHRVSVVLPDDGERLTFCGVDGVRRWRPGHRLSVRVGCDAAHDTNTPTCVELLGELGTDVCRVGRQQAGLRPWGRCLDARPCRRLRCCRGSGRRCRGWWSAGRRPRSQNYSWSPQMAMVSIRTHTRPEDGTHLVLSRPVA